MQVIELTPVPWDRAELLDRLDEQHGLVRVVLVEYRDHDPSPVLGEQVARTEQAFAAFMFELVTVCRPQQVKRHAPTLTHISY